MGDSEPRTRERIKVYLDERQRLDELWQQEERKRWPERGRLKPDELDELARAEHAQGEHLRALAHQHFGRAWESGSVKDPAELWAYITLVAIPVVVALPRAVHTEIGNVLDGFAKAGLSTPPEQTWNTPGEAIRCLRRLADSLFPPTASVQEKAGTAKRDFPVDHFRRVPEDGQPALGTNSPAVIGGFPRIALLESMQYSGIRIFTSR